MDKRVVIAAAMSVLILFAWSYMFPPPKPPQRTPAELPQAVEQQTRPPVRAAESHQEDPRGPADTVPEPEPGASAVQAGSAEIVEVQNGLVHVTLTNHGAIAHSWKLLEYTGLDKQPLELLPQFVDETPEFLAIEVEDARLTEALQDALYRVERRQLFVNGRRGERIDFRWADGRGLVARKSLTFWDADYLVELEVEVVDRGRELAAGLVLGPGFAAQDPGRRSTYYYGSQAVWNSGRVERRKQRKLTGDPGGFSSTLRWVGLEDQYFAALVLPGDGDASVTWRAKELTPRVKPGEEAEAIKEPLLTVGLPNSSAVLYVGPKKHSLLRSMGNELDRVVWFATNPLLAWIARFIFLTLIWIYDHTIQNYGLAIMAATFMLRLLLFPVNQFSMVSMKKTQLQMQRLQPKIKAIRAKHKKAKDTESRNKMNQEMMDLYKREGVNPMGGVSGCLPLLAQFPILIGFYNMLTVAVELRGAPFFGWIHDLSRSDPYWILPLMMGATMFLQQRMAMSKVKDPVQQQQQKFMMVMPFVFTWICLQMPAGLVLYWFVNNVLGIGQQFLVNRHTSRLEAAAQKA